MTLPSDPQARKGIPLYSGLLRYFPAALAEVAAHSVAGNAQHNIGPELFHDRSKSGDELDALMRHLLDNDLAAVAWRALSALQKQCEAEGAPIAPAARNAVTAGQMHEEMLARMIEWDARSKHDLPMMPDALAADSDEDIGLKAGEAVNGFSGLDPLPDQVTPICGTYVFAPDPFDKPRAIPEVGGFMFHTEVD